MHFLRCWRTPHLAPFAAEDAEAQEFALTPALAINCDAHALCACTMQCSGCKQIVLCYLVQTCTLLRRRDSL